MPYVILDPGPEMWEQALQAAAGSSMDSAAAYERLMKYGAGPHFWNEYVVQSYVRHRQDAIYLSGLPSLLAYRAP